MQGSDALAELIGQVMNLPTAKNLPPGVTISQTGDAEVMGEVFEGFALAMGAGLMMVFGVLILLFGNFLQPLTILFSLSSAVVLLGLGVLIWLAMERHFANEDFVVLGDNIIQGNIHAAADAYREQNRGAKILLKKVPDPQRFGVPELNGKRVVRIEEKSNVRQSRNFRIFIPSSSGQAPSLQVCFF